MVDGPIIEDPEAIRVINELRERAREYRARIDHLEHENANLGAAYLLAKVEAESLADRLRAYEGN